jgi:glycosyltransferase involved in cell wall biosynthesis
MVAAQAFARASKGIDASFEVIGAGSEDQALRRYVADAGIADRVQFSGALPQAETLDRLAQLDVVLIPSLSTSTWKEQFGRVAAQAMAAGTAVIASDSGSLREVVNDCGVLVPEGDVEAFAAELRKLLMSPRLIMQLAKRGRERAMLTFSWERVVDRVDVMYRNAVESSARALPGCWALK